MPFDVDGVWLVIGINSPERKTAVTIFSKSDPWGQGGSARGRQPARTQGACWDHYVLPTLCGSSSAQCKGKGAAICQAFYVTVVFRASWVSPQSKLRPASVGWKEGKVKYAMFSNQ